MRKNRALAGAILLAAITILLAPPPVRAEDSQAPVPAPDFPAKVWLNSKPLTIAALRGHVVLVDFWEYTCINCIRTFPYLRRWNRLYAPLGLVIVGVHTPEFDFAKNPALVKSAAHRFGLDFPIAVDSDRTVWAAWRNDAWPADYLVDPRGRIVFTHFGEGDYASMELRIQILLKEMNPSLDFTDAKYRIPADTAEFGGACHRSTPETYLGYERADRFASPGGYHEVAAASYALPNDLPLDSYALDGAWIAMPEYVKLAPGASRGALTLHYRAKSVYLVAGTDSGAGDRLYVEQDGAPVAPDARGVDIRNDSHGRTYIELGHKRMYYVVNNAAFGEHRLRFIASSPAASMYSFTFGNDCETAFDRK